MSNLETRTRRDGEGGSAVTAKFLQARITALSTTLIKRLENIFAAALDENNASGDTGLAPTLTDTSIQQFQLDVETKAIIRAAEEIMMLTRSMKELWLFGGLDTLQQDSIQKDSEARQKEEEDLRIVEKGFKEFLSKHSAVLNGDT